jgi:hypothetical protein
LINVHTLDLCRCEQITDVSMLGNVHSLDLSFSNITDVSALGNVYRLDLTCCDNIKDLSALVNVPNLILPYSVD